MPSWDHKINGACRADACACHSRDNSGSTDGPWKGIAANFKELLRQIAGRLIIHKRFIPPMEKLVRRLPVNIGSGQQHVDVLDDPA